jgi:hypothetical protein
LVAREHTSGRDINAGQVLARAECLKSGNPLDYSQRNSNYERDAFFTKRKKKKLESEHWCAQ